MDITTCSRHSQLIHRMGLGLLEDSEAMKAEEAILHCPECKALWEEEFSDPAFEMVHRGVEDALSSLVLPAKKSGKQWAIPLALAAAATLMLSGAFNWYQHDSGKSLGSTPRRSIARIDFEKGGDVMPGSFVIHQEKADAKSAEAEKRDIKEPLFSDGAEDGSLRSWSLHT